MKLRKGSKPKHLSARNNDDDERTLNPAGGELREKTTHKPSKKIKKGSTPEILTSKTTDDKKPSNARRTSKFKPEIIDFVMGLAPTHSTRQLEDAIKEKFGIRISHVAIARFIKERQMERAEVTLSVVHDYIGKTVPKDLEILEQMRDQLNDLRLGYIINKTMTIPELMAVIDRLRHVIDTRLKFSGATGENNNTKLEDWMK